MLVCEVYMKFTAKEIDDLARDLDLTQAQFVALSNKYYDHKIYYTIRVYLSDKSVIQWVCDSKFRKKTIAHLLTAVSKKCNVKICGIMKIQFSKDCSLYAEQDTSDMLTVYEQGKYFNVGNMRLCNTSPDGRNIWAIADRWYYSATLNIKYCETYCVFSSIIGIDECSLRALRMLFKNDHKRCYAW